MSREIGDESKPTRDEIEKVSQAYYMWLKDYPGRPTLSAHLDLAAEFKMTIGMIRSITDSIPVGAVCTINGFEYGFDSLSRNMAQDAIQVQDACNLGGVSNSFATAVRALHHVPGYDGTNWIRSHPVVVLYVCKIVSLTVGEQDVAAFSAAYDFCKQICDSSV